MVIRSGWGWAQRTSGRGSLLHPYEEKSLAFAVQEGLIYVVERGRVGSEDPLNSTEFLDTTILNTGHL